MSGKVHRLGATETALLDSDMIRVLRQTLGTEQTRELIEDAAFQLTERLSRIEEMIEREEFEALHRLAHGITGLAGQIGLAQLAAVARDLSTVAHDGNRVAARAVAARLLRLGEDSLFSLARHII